MKLHIYGTSTVTLTGAPDELEGEGFNDLSKFSKMRVTTRGNKWLVTGTWRQMAKLTDCEKAADLNEFSQAFKKLHPNIEITLSAP